MACSGGSQAVSMARAKVADYCVCFYSGHPNNSKSGWISALTNTTYTPILNAVGDLALFIQQHNCVYVGTGGGQDLVTQENKARYAACVALNYAVDAGTLKCGSYTCATGAAPCTKTCGANATLNKSNCTCVCNQGFVPQGNQCVCQSRQINTNCQRDCHNYFTWSSGGSRQVYGPYTGSDATGCNLARQNFCFREGWGHCCYYQSGNCHTAKGVGNEGQMCWTSGGLTSCVTRTACNGCAAATCPNNNKSDCARARAQYCKDHGQLCLDGQKYCYVNGKSQCASHGGLDPSQPPGTNPNQPNPPSANCTGGQHQDANGLCVDDSNQICISPGTCVDPMLLLGGGIMMVMLFSFMGR